MEKLKCLLSHRYPQARLKDIFGLAMKTLLEKLEADGRPKKQNNVPRGIQASDTSATDAESKLNRSRYIPRGIRKYVEKRDQQQFQHRKPDGTLCGEKRYLELDHIQPFAF